MRVHAYVHLCIHMSVCMSSMLRWLYVCPYVSQDIWVYIYVSVRHPVVCKYSYLFICPVVVCNSQLSIGHICPFDYSTSSHLITAVMQSWVWLVLVWVITWAICYMAAFLCSCWLYCRILQLLLLHLWQLCVPVLHLWLQQLCWPPSGLLSSFSSVNVILPPHLLPEDTRGVVSFATVPQQLPLLLWAWASLMPTQSAVLQPIQQCGGMYSLGVWQRVTCSSTFP